MITLESIESKHSELAALIAQFKQQAALTIRLRATEIELQSGERYAGATLNADGSVQHHIVLLAARPDKDLDWDDAKAWAGEAGGELPTRQEQSLLFANCRDALPPQSWCWSSEPHGARHAWGCSFTNGLRSCGYHSSECNAVAIRRVSPR